MKRYNLFISIIITLFISLALSSCGSNSSVETSSSNLSPSIENLTSPSEHSGEKNEPEIESKTSNQENSSKDMTSEKSASAEQQESYSSEETSDDADTPDNQNAQEKEVIEHLIVEQSTDGVEGTIRETYIDNTLFAKYYSMPSGMLGHKYSKNLEYMVYYTEDRSSLNIRHGKDEKVIWETDTASSTRNPQIRNMTISSFGTDWWKSQGDYLIVDNQGNVIFCVYSGDSSFTWYYYDNRTSSLTEMMASKMCWPSYYLKSSNGRYLCLQRIDKYCSYIEYDLKTNTEVLRHMDPQEICLYVDDEGGIFSLSGKDQRDLELVYRRGDINKSYGDGFALKTDIPVLIDNYYMYYVQNDSLYELELFSGISKRIIDDSWKFYGIKEIGWDHLYTRSNLQPMMMPGIHQWSGTNFSFGAPVSDGKCSLSGDEFYPILLFEDDPGDYYTYNTRTREKLYLANSRELVPEDIVFESVEKAYALINNKLYLLEAGVNGNWNRTLLEEDFQYICNDKDKNALSECFLSNGTIVYKSNGDIVALSDKGKKVLLHDFDSTYNTYNETAAFYFTISEDGSSIAYNFIHANVQGETAVSLPSDLTGLFYSDGETVVEIPSILGGVFCFYFYDNGLYYSNNMRGDLYRFDVSTQSSSLEYTGVTSSRFYRIGIPKE